MTAAGVQTNDSAAYLPAPPSTSTPDAKGTGAATDASAANAPGASDFQSELEAQQSDAHPAESKAQPKADPSKPGKKRNTPDDASLAAVTPVQITEPQKQILPLALALAQPLEKATPDQTASSNPTSSAGTEPGKIPVLPLVPVPSVIQDIPVRQEGKESEDPASQDQATALTKPGASSNRPPVSPADLTLPATPPEPVASAVQDTLDRAASSPSALAFAARMTAPQQKSDPVAASPSQSGAQSGAQSAAISGSQTAVQIPVRYAATAQIIQSAALGTKQDGPKKDTGDSSDRSARPDARTDAVLPQFETTSQPAGSSGSTAPQQTAPPARAESILEPPAAPPTSSHDIRVRVPDNNGGSTQIRFVESGGEVRVSVHTADESLAQNLRTHLNDLTQRLSDGGMPAEFWKPAANAASSQNDSQQQFQQDGRGSGGQGSGGQNGQQDREQRRPAWLDEMEASLHGEQN